MSRRFRYYVRVRYQDCDSQHVVFNARYCDYLDLAITEFLRASLPGRDPMGSNFEIQVKKQTVEWQAPARFNDVLEIETWVSRMGASSFDVQFDIRRAGTADVIVRAITVYVHVVDDGGVWRSAPIAPGPRAELLEGARGRIVDHAGFYPIVVPD
jgi:acyl-CoA thioester hydrolase